MHYTYRMKETCLCDEQGTKWTVYGVEAVDATGNILSCFSDVFFDRESAKSFVRACNEQEVELLHIRDVVDDALVEQYIMT